MLIKIKKALRIDYHQKLIEILIVSTVSGVLSANIIAPFMVAYVLYGSVPSLMISIWLLLHFTLFAGRIFMSKKLHYFLRINSEKTTKYLKIIFVLTSSTAFLYAIAAWSSVLYAAPDLHVLMIGTIMMALIAGSITTLVSVFHSFVLYIFFSVLPLVGAVLYHGGDIFKIFALLLSIFSLTIILAGYRQFQILRSSIALEEEKEISIKKVEALNESLTSRVKLEVEKNRQIDEQLFQQSRLAQMGEMLSMIAHQWRQPLTAISATSSWIELRARFNQLENDTVQKKAKDISNYAQHLSETIDDFRNFFKQNKEQKETSYDEIVQSILSIIEASIINQNIELHQELNCHNSFTTFPNELRQVVLNLIKNAEDVLLEKKVKNPFIKIETYQKGEKYILEISDNGGGISEDIIEHIFDPYFSTKNEKNGTGLGLYMSKTIIEEHCAGKLSVENRENGALFRIIL